MGQGKERPADIFIPKFNLEKDTIIDVVVVDPLQVTYFDDTLAGRSAADLYAANVKEARYKKQLELDGYSYKPMVIETSGGWCDETLQVIDSITKQWTQRLETDAFKVRAVMFQRLAATVQRSCSAMVLSRLPKDS